MMRLFKDNYNINAILPGVYDEAVRRSRWIRVDDDGQLVVAGSSDTDSLDRKSCHPDGPQSRESTRTWKSISEKLT